MRRQHRRDKPGKPFRCLDPQYRRELVRVYLTNVEGICRRFCEDKRARLAWAKDEIQSFKQFWSGLTPELQRKLMTDKAEAILKVRSSRLCWPSGHAYPGNGQCAGCGMRLHGLGAATRGRAGGLW